MLSAGTNVEWLRDDLGIIADAADVRTTSPRRCADTDGVVYVPALLGLGTPQWDYGARGALFGLTRGTEAPPRRPGRARGRRPARAPTSSRPPRPTATSQLEALRIDGGMTANPTFVQALADATQRPVEVSPVLEATTLGAGFLAGLATGVWGSWDDVGGDLVAAGAGRAAAPSTDRTAGAMPWSAPASGSRTSPPWTSERGTVDSSGRSGRSPGGPDRYHSSGAEVPTGAQTHQVRGVP